MWTAGYSGDCILHNWKAENGRNNPAVRHILVNRTDNSLDTLTAACSPLSRSKIRIPFEETMYSVFSRQITVIDNLYGPSVGYC